MSSRNLRLLVAAQAIGGASAPIIISLGGLVGQSLAADSRLATLPVSLYNLGVAISTIGVALLVSRLGRRGAYLIGAGVAVISGSLSAWAIADWNFVLFCISTTIAGLYGACVQSYRFAAADEAAPDLRARAISRIMLGGLAAAIIGPQIVIWTRDAFPAAPFSGSFLGQAALALLALPVIASLGRSARADSPTVIRPTAPPSGRPLSMIVRTPGFIVAVAAGAVSFGLMSFAMTAAPIAMVGCGFTVGEAALGIQWHVLAMFAPSFATPRLISWMGKTKLTVLGLVLMGAASLLAIEGLELMNFWGSLVLLGVGWNFSFVGATAMVADFHRPEERTRVQALNDLLVFGSVALASFGSGHLLAAIGWEGINILMLPALATVIAIQGWSAYHRRHDATASPGKPDD